MHKLAKIKFIIPIIPSIFALFKINNFYPNNNLDEKIKVIFFYFTSIWYSYLVSKNYRKMARSNEYKINQEDWISKEDGILVEDQNNNTKIDNITKTISEYYKLQASNWTKDAEGKYSSDGLATLKKLDSNHDNKFNNQDTKWHDLKIWQDVNGDAQTDVGELKTLTEAGIKEIDLASITQASKERNEGNIILAKTTYTTTDNQTKQIVSTAEDTLVGSSGNDYVDGGYGDDLIRGHRGSDVLITSTNLL